MPITNTEPTPAERAATAAEALAAEGLPVTARAVRSRAGVMTTIASEAAKQWHQQQAQAISTPAMPATVTRRLEAIWAEAFHAARELFDAEADSWSRRIETAEAEQDHLLAELERAQNLIDRIQDQHEETIKDVTKAADRIEELMIKLGAAEQHAAAAEARADTAEAALKEVLTTLKPQTRKTTATKA